MTLTLAITVALVNIVMWGAFLWWVSKPQREERRRERRIRRSE